MTERENQLLDIAEKIIWLNQDLKPALTGSFRLVLLVSEADQSKTSK